MAAASTTKQKPAWLEKHASFEYLTSVLDTLSQRETVRDAARYTSLQPSRNGTNSTSWPRLRKLKLNFRSPDTLPATNYYSITHGMQVDNRNRNRYTDIIPYDRTRIRVPPVGQQATQNAEEPANYLNASWVLERYGHKWWIASQAPLPHTAYTFLSIFLQPSTAPPEALSLNTPSDIRPKFGRIRTVVQLTQNLESGRRKAHAYFPDTVGSSLIVLPDNNTRDASSIHSSGLKATLIQVKNITEANCVQSTISVSPVTFKERRPNTSPSPSGVSNNVDFTVDDSSAVTFHHMLFTAWPDHGVPTAKDRDSLLAFIRLVDQTNREVPPTTSPGEDSDPDPPIIVGCSAGIGRTGSFIALSSLLRAFGFLPPANAPTDASVVPTSPLGTLPKEFEEDMVALEIDLLREQRPRMVEREEQVECIYEVLASAFEAQGASSG